MKIKDILKIDLSQDIKNVIDLEDISEKEILTEIENYIVTEGLARKYTDFAGTFTSNILETGVWISGFYGSGKSYFGKLLGYMLGDRMIAGTLARDRILQRFTGVQDEALVKHALMGLSAQRSRVVFLDIAKQDTSKGFSFTLFKIFLRSLDLPENEHGFFLYHLMLQQGRADIHGFIRQMLKADWNDLKRNLVNYARATKEVFLQLGNSITDYDHLITTVRREIDEFSAASLREELKKYLDVVRDETVVFLFDEASEAIYQKKYTLLDLEGLSEALSALGRKVWTIAIAQEKLDDIINNANVTKAHLTKVTDRFKTKIHLEATEVDVIIRQRLLNKSEEGRKALLDHFGAHSGKIADHAAITGAGMSRTDNAEGYVTYYPFYKHQFDLLQNFLFGTKGYASTKVAARGMIITTYDILRQEVQQLSLYHTVTGWQIAREGQPQPNVRLVSRYDNAERILSQAGMAISGRQLLETIHFLSEAEVSPTTFSNIVRSFISEPEEYHRVQETIKKALELLVEAKVLLESQATYRITSDMEQRMLDEMNGYTVQAFSKKNKLLQAYKVSAFVRSLAKISDQVAQYDFHVTTDAEDELHTPALKFLKVKVKSVYNMSDDRQADIEALKTRHQNDKDLLWVVPDNSSFRELDRLIDEVERIAYLEQKYTDIHSEESRILKTFQATKDERQKRIADLVEQAFLHATVVYLYNTYQLGKDTWQAIVQGRQREIVQNVYSRRLASHLSEQVATGVIREAMPEQLHRHFTGEDFAFFDGKGNFIGEHLKVAEAILHLVRNAFVEGSQIEEALERPPTGFPFGTLMASVAALMRAGKLIAKHNGAEKFHWRDEGVPQIFSSAREFRKSAFKAVSRTLTLQQRQDIVQFLLDIGAERASGRRVDFNTNDFELINTVRETARHFAEKVATLRGSEPEFDTLFPAAQGHADLLGGFTGAVSEANYIDKANELLAGRDGYAQAVGHIDGIEQFMRLRLAQVKVWRTFVKDVEDELRKAALDDPAMKRLYTEFDRHLRGDITGQYMAMQKLAQQIKDAYHLLFERAMAHCAAIYQPVADEAEALVREIEGGSADVGGYALGKARTLASYARQRSDPAVGLEFDVKDKDSRFTYSEVLSFIELGEAKKAELERIRAGLDRAGAPPAAGDVPGVGSRRFVSRLPGKRMKAGIYKAWLQEELRRMADAAENDDIEIE